MGQNILIFEKLKDDTQKEYYIKNTIENGWNRNVLMHHIKTNLFDRDKIEVKSNNFEVALTTELSELALDIIKSEYNLEFMEVSKNVHERQVENKLVENIKKFLLELGYGLQSVVHPMGVSIYTVKEQLPDELVNALPTKNELKEIIQRDKLTHQMMILKEIR